MSELNNKIITATKWSSITEIAAKLVAPVSSMVLARILTPEAFGVMVTAMMVISFAQIFTDAGFQKYLVQHDFRNQESLFASTNVAFWTNLIMSIIIWLIIIIFSEPIAELVGNKGYGLVIAVSSICIPLAAFSSIQMALYRRKLDFKTLFWVRLIGVCIPIVITIPLAIILHSYWALIFGMIALNASNAIILTWKSEWRPKFEYDFSLLKQMFSFTSWSMIEAIAIWLTMYIDLFFVGKMLNDYYLGIYRTSMSTVGQIVGIITEATTPILFSSLSRVQSNKYDFEKIFFKFQKVVSILVIPLGVYIYTFRFLLTDVLLGSQWHQAADFIGLWGLTSSITIVLGHYSSECYRAKGKPQLSLFVQITHIAVLIPIVLWAIPHGFNFLCEARSVVRLEYIIASMVLMPIFVKISPWAMIKNIFPAILGGIMIIIVRFVIPSIDILPTIIAIIISTIAYIGVIMSFPQERHILLNLKSILKR